MIFNYINWNADPEIINVLGISVRYYGLLFVSGLILCIYLLGRIYKIENIPYEHLEKLSIYGMIGILAGARLGHCLFYQPEYYLRNPWEILFIWHGGLASHGAAIGILLSLYFFARKNKKPYLWILDRIVIVVALAGFFIRMGNLMNSEIYGIETSLPWGFIFIRDGQIVPKHPTQIYEALCYLVIFIVLYLIYLKKTTTLKNGFIFSLFLISLFTVRFFIEFIKEVQVDFESSMSLNMGQWLSIPFVLVGIFLLINSQLKKT